MYKINWLSRLSIFWRRCCEYFFHIIGFSVDIGDQVQVDCYLAGLSRLLRAYCWGSCSFTNHVCVLRAKALERASYLRLRVPEGVSGIHRLWIMQYGNIQTWNSVRSVLPPLCRFEQLERTSSRAWCEKLLYDRKRWGKISDKKYRATDL